MIDLCRNLRNVDQESTILLYNGGDDAGLLAPDPVFERLGVVVHPSPRPVRWGALHPFALDCMRFAQADQPFDSLTIVDSDQLALRPGWPARIQECLTRDRGIGLLSNQPERMPPATDNAAALTAWQEVELWRPFLKQFPDGEDKFVHWGFWPGTVFSADTTRALLDRFDHDDDLREIMRQSHLWVTEEIVFPTLTALLGFRVARSPDNYRYLRYRYPYSWTDLESALADPDAFWIHPIPRRPDDPLRVAIRQRLGQDAPAVAATEAHVVEPRPVPAIAYGNLRPSLGEIRAPIVNAMREISGWLADDEADLLITATDQALTASPNARAVVEVGSFRGKATTVLASVVRSVRPEARVWAIDPHDGVVGDLDRGTSQEGPTLDLFRHNIARAGLDAFVETVQARTPEVAWSEPICLLLVDGLHDYASVARDFRHFEPFLADSALVAFHDYADYFPGVKTFVDELLKCDRYVLADRASSMIVLRKQAAAIATPMETAAPEALAAAS